MIYYLRLARPRENTLSLHVFMMNREGLCKKLRNERYSRDLCKPDISRV
jgi:hypothetical protein